MLFQYKHLDKTKTFESVNMINWFIGASSEYQGKFDHKPISISLFYKIKTLYPNMSQIFTYDDGTEIGASEWVECVTQLMTKYR